MQVNIKRGIHGAKQCRGLGVIIDVFRGSSTIIAIFARRARYVIPVVTLKEARKLKKKNPDYLLIGERKGKTPKNFDCGNSPFETSFLPLKGKNVIFRSSAASKGIIEARSKAKISELLIGSFLNAKGILNYVKEKSPEEITLVAMGTLGLGRWRMAIEDEHCANYIKKLLEEEKVDFPKIKDEILKGEGAARLVKYGQFRDLEICLTPDLFEAVVPRMRKNETKVHV